MMELNLPIWNPENPKTKGAFQEVWYLKLNDPAKSRALWLRFTMLVSGNGFKRIAETWAIYFERGANREVTKIALKQTHELRSFTASPEGVRIGECELTAEGTRGVIQSKGRTIKWDLKLQPARPGHFNFVPEGLTRAGIVKNTAVTAHEDLRFSGTSEINGETQTWEQAPGMQGHLSGPRNGHSWVWGHCNTFVNEQGKPVPFVFEGLSARARVAGGLPTPKLSAFYFNYQDQEYIFNSVWDAMRCRSQNTLTDWKFQADRGDLSFRGHASAQYRDFAGITYEDTDGSLLYCANSKLSDLTILVYRRGKLEATFTSNGTAAFEVVSREKNPYVPLLI